jgi:hypothetical protein
MITDPSMVPFQRGLVEAWLDINKLKELGDAWNTTNKGKRKQKVTGEEAEKDMKDKEIFRIGKEREAMGREQSHR